MGFEPMDHFWTGCPNQRNKWTLNTLDLKSCAVGQAWLPPHSSGYQHREIAKLAPVGNINFRGHRGYPEDSSSVATPALKRIPTEGDSQAASSEFSISEDTEGTEGHLGCGYPRNRKQHILEGIQFGVFCFFYKRKFTKLYIFKSTIRD